MSQAEITSDTRPFWSVMIPTYNARLDQLEETLRSVLKQDPGAEQMQFEVIDDCSPNGSPEPLLRRLSGDRILIRRNEKNLGLAGTWNECVKRARGKWVHVLHQDDLVLPGFYERLRAGLESTKGIGAAFCRHAFIDEKGHQTGVSDLEQAQAGPLRDFKYTLVRSNRIQCAGIVVAKSTYEELGGFRTDLTYVLDWELWLRISLAKPVWYEPEVLACYRQHSANATTSLQRSGADVREIGAFLNSAERSLGDEAGRRATKWARRHYAERALGIAAIFAKAGDKLGARNQMAEAWRLYPSVRLIWGSFKCIVFSVSKAGS